MSRDDNGHILAKDWKSSARALTTACYRLLRQSEQRLYISKIRNYSSASKTRKFCGSPSRSSSQHLVLISVSIHAICGVLHYDDPAGTWSSSTCLYKQVV